MQHVFQSEDGFLYHSRDQAIENEGYIRVQKHIMLTQQEAEAIFNAYATGAPTHESDEAFNTLHSLIIRDG